MPSSSRQAWPRPSAETPRALQPPRATRAARRRGRAVPQSAGGRAGGDFLLRHKRLPDARRGRGQGRAGADGRVFRRRRREPAGGTDDWGVRSAARRVRRPRGGRGRGARGFTEKKEELSAEQKAVNECFLKRILEIVYSAVELGEANGQTERVVSMARHLKYPICC